MADAILDLAGYPTPNAIEPLDVETILAAHLARFLEEWNALRVARPDLNLPEFDTTVLETEETRILFGVSAFRELLLRGRINDAVRANLLAYATGADLDHLAAWYGVVRMFQDGVFETDARLRTRVILAIQGRSTGGTAPRYRAVAMGADLRVADANVYREGRDPTVNIALFATNNDGVADAALIATVSTAVNAPAVRMVNDTLAVRSAVFEVVNVAAQVWLLPETPDSALASLVTNLRASWADETGLGFDLTTSWLTARLMRAGVQKVVVTAPAGDIVAAPHRAISIGSVVLTNMGRAF